MNRKLQTNAEQYVKKTRGRRRWQWFVRFVASIVVFCTTYALILPAITMEQKAYCGLEEHVHDDSCYIQILDSQETTEAPHVHTDACLDASGAEICGFHVHSDSCYTKERGDLLCQQTEQEGHAHTEQCYGDEPVMICQQQETDGHTHGDTCYTSQPVLSCQMDVAEAHTHGEGCFDAEGTLICQQEETDGHTHGEDCYTEQPVLSCQLPEAEAHTHGDGCWEYPLICGQTVAEGHTHNDDCYQWSSNLTCDLPLAPAETTPPQPELTCQDPTHDHTARCYGTWELCCGMEEHTHDLRCFSDPDADVETREIWERTFADVELTGVWAEDVLAIARSQLGYQESTRNYDVWEDGTTHGYTRYGHWYGSPYGDWCAMFASFCIAYAGVDEEAMPLNWGCRTWIADLSQPELDLYRPAADYTPKPGDLIFFDWEDAEGNSDDLSDHVGIVAELIPETEETPARIKTIEGNSSNQVKYNTYDQADTQILGYGVIPENPANLEETEPPQETGPAFTYSDEELYVEVRLPADTTVPADAVLWVTPIDEESADYAAYLARSEEAVEGTVAGIALYDISFYTPDGEYLPVSDRAEVIMGFTKSPVDGEGELQVLHFAQEDTPPQVIDQVTLGEQELEMRPNVQDQPALMALDLPGEPTEETQPATETEPAEETITEVRTVLQFQTDGFSTFAVVQVQTPYVTTILTDDQMTQNLNGKIFAISTRVGLTHNGETAYRGLTSTPTGVNHLAAKTVTHDENSITVSKKMLWKFEAVAGENNTYYVRPYDPVTNKAKGYLKIGEAEVLSVVNEIEDGCTILLQATEYGTPSFQRPNGRYLAYSTDDNRFTSYNTPDNNRGNLILSEYGEPAGDKQLPVTNLAGQKLAIVSVRDMANDPRHVVLSTTGTVGQDIRLNSEVVPNESFTNGVNGLISIEGEAPENWFWTFEDADAANGVYYIRGSNNQYMTITGNGTATTTENKEQAQITVSSYVVNGNVVITLKQGDYYLNRYGGSNFSGYGGWNGEGAPADAGSRFVLARREQFTAEVISRAELWAAGRWTGNKLIFFVRQTDDLGNTRYFAMNVDGSATEIFLEPGQTLEDGATIYADEATRDKFLWDATGSPTDGWNSEKNVNGAIDLWPRYTSGGNELVVLSPNGDGGWGNRNSADETYRNEAQGTPSLTSHVETDNNWGWFIKDGEHENRKGSPLRGEHNAAFYKIADNSQADINPDIASTIISKLDYFEQSWKSGYIEFDGGQFVAKNSDNDSYDTQKGVPATDSTAFYVAVLNIPEEEVKETSESHDTVVAKILTRHEYQDAVQIDGDARIILLTRQGNDYYALDYQGNAVKLDTLNGDEKAVVLAGDENYNTNRILWDAVPTNVNPETGMFIDMTLENEAVYDLYLSPLKNDLREQLVSRGHPAVAEHSTGFYGLSESGSLIITSEDGTSGTVIKYDNGKYVLETVNTLTNTKDGAYTFYVALVTDSGVNYKAENKTVEQYGVVPAVKENVRMKLFNYGSAIDYYGQTYNNTVYDDGQNENGNLNKDNLIYRFFHRPSFTGQAIDGTNEKNDEYALADAFDGNYANGISRRQFGPTLGENGAPYLMLHPYTSASCNNDKFSLGYLFNTQRFVTTSENLTLRQTNGDDWQQIENATGTDINPNGGTTAPANSYDPVINPNYAVQSFDVTNNGEGTGLFQFDYDTGNYYYDSANNAAWYNPDSKKMELYNYALVPSGSLLCIGGNFLPFNKGHEEGRLVPTQEEWKDDHTDYGINSRTYQLNGIHHDDDPVIGRSSMTDLWFGMTLEIEFTMTADGTLVPIDPSGKALDNIGRKDMIFEFTGDDDVLVYVDGVLCLDIGGIHGAEYGDINFHTGVIHKGRKDERQSTLQERFTAAGKGNEIQNGTLKPWTKHTLQFFYLERGGNISNCRIGYNLADIPIGGMSVTKEVEGITDDQEYYGEYKFQLTNVTLGTYNSGEALDLYYIIRDQKGQTVQAKTGFSREDLTGDKVTFTLKANQTAEFFGFPAGTQLQVKEIEKQSGEEISKVKMVNADGTGEAAFQESDWVSSVISIGENNMEECQVTCTNQLEKVEVDISKALAMLEDQPVEGMENTEFQFTYTITKPGGTTGVQETLTLKPNEHQKLTVPFGSWLNIQEVTVNGYKVEWDYKVKKAEENGGAIVDKSHVPDDDFQTLPGIHLVGDTEIICRNLMTFVEVTKTVEGNVKEGESYQFDYTVEYNGEEVRNGDFSLSHDGTYRISNIPIGSKVTVTEGKGDYLTSYVITDWKPTTGDETPAQGESQKKVDGSTATCDKMEPPQVIHFTNRPVYYLPDAGGTGTQLYTIGGLLLMAAAILLYYQIRRRKGDYASP